MPTEPELLVREASEAPLPDSYIIESESPDIDLAVRNLRERGYVILRGCLPKEAVDAVAERTEEMLRQPSVAGVWGYYRADHQKKVIQPTLLGASVYPVIANERVLDITEAYLGSKCVLAETNLKADRGMGYVYFPMHTDFAAGWHKSAEHVSPITEEIMKLPLGVGGAIYLHDTSEGAFSYCTGTHKLGAPHGQRLSEYPKAMQDEIVAKKVRLDGRKGDIVLFDDSGFHGPDHPSRADRTLILVDYYRTDILGNEQVTPLPIWSCDIGGLSPRQLRVLGADSSFVRPFDRYKWSKIKNSWAFGPISFLIENAFIGSHLRMKLKSMLSK
jgi:ectoine hydroxylase-related dioxygenase (phytanoyl-CoA dioxygenase family)